MYKKIFQKECCLKDAKENVSCDDLYETPSRASQIIELFRVRLTENKKSLQGTKSNFPEMKIACEHFSKPSAVGDAMYRDRSIGYSHNVSSFSCVLFSSHAHGMHRGFG